MRLNEGVPTRAPAAKPAARPVPRGAAPVVERSVPKAARSVTGSTPSPVHGASNVDLETLQRKGWKTPERQAEVTRPPEELFAIKRTSYLQPYAYAVSDREWELLTDTFGKKEGFAPPGRGGVPGFTGTWSTTTPSSTQEKDRQRTRDLQPTRDPGIYQSAELTWDAYRKLTPEQRNRVDFNSLIVDARQKDLGEVTKPTDEQRAKYDQTVEEMFGKDGGSVVYAPETVQTLKELNFKAVGQDLDEYLSMERLTSLDDLKGAVFSTAALKELKGGNYAEVRSPANLAALESQTAARTAAVITEVMTDANAALQDFRTSMAADRWNAVKELGGSGLLTDTDPMAGFFPVSSAPGQETPQETQAQYFRNLYELAKDKTLDLSAWTEKSMITDPELKFNDRDWANLFNYFDIRTRQEERWGAQLPGETGDGVRTSDEIRALFGLEK